MSSDAIRQLGRDPRAGVRAIAKRAFRRAEREERETHRLEQMLTFERRHWRGDVARVAGVDEVGVGPLAGPVVAAAVILPVDMTVPGIDDSKRLTRQKRQQLDEFIRRHAVAISIGRCSPKEIDAVNILQASRIAMQRAVDELDPTAQHLLVDARQVPGVRMQQTALVHGDRRSQSIAAASIVAKVYRDALMSGMANDYPGYGFERHAGYGTQAHMAALRALGPSPIHRLSFAPVAAAARSVARR